MPSLAYDQYAAEQRRRKLYAGDSGFAPLEPDTTTAEELKAQAGRDLEAYQGRQEAERAQEQQIERERTDAKRLFFSGLFGALGGDTSTVSRLSDAIRARREREAREAELTAKMEKEKELAEQRRMDSLAVTLGEPALAHSPFLADVLRTQNERREAERQRLLAEKEGERRQAAAEKEAQLNKPISVSPEAGVWDPKTRQFIVKPQFRPQQGQASSENTRRDDREKAIERVNKYREASSDYRAQMEAIRAEVSKKGSAAWDKAAVDPETGYPTGLTNRQAYNALKRKNDAAVGEINRLWGVAGELRGGSAAPEAGPAAPGGRPDAPAGGALASALEKEARGEPITSLTTKERKALIAYKEKQGGVQPGGASAR